MTTLLAVGSIVIIFYYLIQFARREHIEEYYEDAIIDVEGRLDWARSRRFHPFGMKAQLEVSADLLAQAKRLWHTNNSLQAYRAARQAQDAMNRAQNIYCRAIGVRQPAGNAQ
jgi:hypothetical protein